MPRLTTLALLLFSMLTTAFAEPTHFVALAWVPAEKQRQYESFITKVAPLWERHGMTLLARHRTIDVLGSDTQAPIPGEIAMLQIDSMDRFRAYLDDPDYKMLSSQRLAAVDRMVVLEGNVLGEDRSKFFATTPLAAFLFDGQTGDDSPPHLQLSITSSSAIKGEVDPFFGQVETVRIMALSYDDDPTGYSPAPDRPAMITIGESLQPSD